MDGKPTLTGFKDNYAVLSDGQEIFIRKDTVITEDEDEYGQYWLLTSPHESTNKKDMRNRTFVMRPSDDIDRIKHIQKKLLKLAVGG